jgi:ferric-dicitrate binding protein FerR (iron transport regulator)
MKTRDFDQAPRAASRPRNSRRRDETGLGFGVALLGGLCVLGVFAMLALLYHL